MLSKTSQLAIAASAAAFAAATPAHAGCHLIDCVENVYVKPSELKSQSCETLWILRNSIFKDAGYCFKSERAAKWFGNEGCTHDDQSAVPLNDYQRHNIEVIEAREAEKGC